MENYELRHKTNFKSISQALAFYNYQKINAKDAINAFLKPQFFATYGLSTETLMQKIILVVTQKNEFLSRDGSKKVAHFGNLGISKFYSKEHNEILLNRIPLHEEKVFDRGLDRPWIFPILMILMQGSKSMIFHTNAHLQA